MASTLHQQQHTQQLLQRRAPSPLPDHQQQQQSPCPLLLPREQQGKTALSSAQEAGHPCMLLLHPLLLLLPQDLLLLYHC